MKSKLQNIKVQLHIVMSLNTNSIRFYQKSTGEGRPFFLVHGDKSNEVFAEYFEGKVPIYAFYHQGNDGSRMKYTTIHTIAAQYVECIFATQKSGPYRIGGYSIGGLIAYEMARIITNKGYKVENVVLIDTRTPDCTGERDYHNLQFRYTESRVFRLLKKYLKKAAISIYLILDRPIPEKLRPIYIMETYRASRANYVIQDCFVKVILMRSENENFKEATLGWGKHLSDNLEVFHIPGNHHSILKRQSVIKMAQILETLLL